jgi:transcriptional regulator with XRE-family HTH domain
MLQVVKDKTFGEYIKYLRKCNGYTQVDLAVIINSNYQNVSSLERNKFGPSLAYIYRLSEAFNLSIVDFIQGFEDFKNQM